METKNFDIFCEVKLDSDSEYCSDSDSDIYFQKPISRNYDTQCRREVPILETINFGQYVKETYEGKVKLLNRDTFKQITRPIIIFFNHFEEKCAYHLESLDLIYQLALKYGDQIEFIVADLYDIDILKYKRHSIDSYCSMGNPEVVPLIIYAIDERKRVHEHFPDPQTLECLSELCEQLLKGQLFKSQPLPEPNNSQLVKICVHDNYRELVADSEKHVLLVANYKNYSDLDLEQEPNYEIVAKELAPYNVDVVYLNGDKNYMPFELGIAGYTSYLFIPHNDKTNFLNPILGPLTAEGIVSSIKTYLENPQPVLEKIEKSLRKGWYVPLNITPDLNLDFKEQLPQYLEENCRTYVQVFEREAFLKSKDYIILAFMDFSSGKCSAQQLKWIDEIYQVSVTLASDRQYFIADFQDIDVINLLWKTQDLKQIKQNGELQIYGVDLHKNKYVLRDFKNATSLYYFAYSLLNGDFYKCQPWPLRHQEKLVKTCTDDSLNLCISSIKKDIVLAIYHSNAENSEEFLRNLEELAREMKRNCIKFMKIDARLNYITFELDDNKYPILYFIPEKNKNQRLRFAGDNFSKDNIRDFISKNVEISE